MNVHRVLARFVSRLPGAGRLNAVLRRRYDTHGSNPFIRFAPPGHFYSPIPDLQLVDRYKDSLFNRGVTDVPGIEIRADDQLALLEQFARYHEDLPFTDEQAAGLRYYFVNPFYSYGDAIVLYSMLRHHRPRRIIEVGSGFSSAVMLDTNDRFLSRQVAMTFIDPYPDRLLSLLTGEDATRQEIVTDIVQNVPLERFEALRAGDILFIDSSHVAKIGSDVVHLVTAVLPRLNRGVIVHFHDVFWPFEYPEEWVRAGRAWNENYVLKAFLQFNARFRVIFFNSYIAIHHGETAARRLPLFMKNPGGGLWIEKVS